MWRWSFYSRSLATKKKSAKPAKKKTGAKKKRAKAKSAAPRVTPKVSLLKGTNVDDWARKLNG